MPTQLFSSVITEKAVLQCCGSPHAAAYLPSIHLHCQSKLLKIKSTKCIKLVLKSYFKYVFLGLCMVHLFMVGFLTK